MAFPCLHQFVEQCLHMAFQWPSPVCISLLSSACTWHFNGLPCLHQFVEQRLHMAFQWPSPVCISLLSSACTWHFNGLPLPASVCSAVPAHGISMAFLCLHQFVEQCLHMAFQWPSSACISLLSSACTWHFNGLPCLHALPFLL